MTAIKTFLMILIFVLAGCEIEDKIKSISPLEEKEVTHKIERWENGEIYYTYKNKNSFNERLIKLIEKAMRSWEDGTSVAFIEIEETEKEDYNYTYTISLNEGNVYYSSLGQKKNARLRLGSEGHSQRVIAHELGHCLGLIHEHQRPDRDKHIIINWENIVEEFKYEFEIKESPLYDVTSTRYDIKSIMHYGCTTHSIAINKQTIELKTPAFRLYNASPTEEDIYKVNLIYGN